MTTRVQHGATLAVLALALTGCVSASDPDSEVIRMRGIPAVAKAITLGTSAAVPIGYYELCKTDHPVCRQSRGGVATTRSGVVQLDDRLAAQMITVNADVNRTIKPLRDPRWRVSPIAGDCKDFALTKKHRLMSMGWPSSALLIATAVTSWGEEHAVLIVRTNRGDMVLDNLVRNIRGWSPSLYRWKSVQSPKQAWSWVTVASALRHEQRDRRTAEG